MSDAHPWASMRPVCSPENRETALRGEQLMVPQSPHSQPHSQTYSPHICVCDLSQSTLDADSSTERNDAREGKDGGAPLVAILADEVRAMSLRARVCVVRDVSGGDGVGGVSGGDGAVGVLDGVSIVVGGGGGVGGGDGFGIIMVTTVRGK